MTENNNETFTQKIILLVIGAIIGALLKGFFDYFLQEDNQSAADKLARDKFQSDLVIQSLANPNFSQAIKNLNFIIDAELVKYEKDEIKKIKDAAVKYEPKIQPEESTGTNPVRSSCQTSACLELEGFKALLARNLGQSQKLFESAYKLDPIYHNVDEINKLIKNKTKVNNWGEEIYCPIVKDYSWRMPNEIKTEMKKQGNCP